MSHGSLSLTSFPAGHDVASYPASTAAAYFATFDDHAKQSSLSTLNPFGYNPHLGTDDFSQSSSEDSYSQSSDSSLVSPPFSHASDDFAEKVYEDTEPTLSSHATDRSPISPCRAGDRPSNQISRKGGWPAQNHKDNYSFVEPCSQSNMVSPQRSNTLPGEQVTPLSQNRTSSTRVCAAPVARRSAKSVPFRPRVNATTGQSACDATQQVLTDMVDAPSAIPLDTSCPPSDIQRSRARVEPTVPSALPIHGRRGRSISTAAGPPKLRRDTDHTDAIVKMIVLFCVNLINSIWTPSGSPGYESDAAQAGSNVLPLQVFITETLRRSKTSYSTLQIALYYLILLKQCLPQQGYAGQSTAGCRATQCGRRMFLTALILASKYLQDRNYSARAWSKISGLPLKEINENERRYLSICSWDLHVPKDTFENWSRIVLSVCRQSVDPELCRPGASYQGPPSSGPTGQTCFLQKMCKTSLTALRNWWLSNLRGLCTDIVRCPRKTEGYISSIMPFRDTTYLPRPIFESPVGEDFFDASSGQETPRSLECLPSLPNMPDVSKYLIHDEQANSPAATMAIPPPPVLPNLPTPQTTPRTDMSHMWTPRLGGPNVRCRASALALANLDKNRCPMANLETCPPPKPRTCTQQQQSWRDHESVPVQHVTDRSSNSSPESVASDVFSLPGRSRSSSISSTSSWMTSSSMSSLPSEKDRYERVSLQLNPVKQQHALQDALHSTGRRQQPVPRRFASTFQCDQRPQTAFRVGEVTDQAASISAQKWVDASYTSDETGLDNEVLERETTARILAGLQTSKWNQDVLTRPSVHRNMTQVQEPRKQDKAQLLKRSRTESLDMSQDHTPVSSTFQDFMEQHMKLAQPKSNCLDRTSAMNWRMCSDKSPTRKTIDKETQQPNQEHLPPRMPVQLATQKRLALQVSPAAQFASDYLKHDAALGRLGSVC